MKLFLSSLQILSSGLFLWGIWGLMTVSQAQSPTDSTELLLPPESPVPTFRYDDIVPQTQSPPNFDPLTSQQFNLYRLSIGDSISVTVTNFPEFSFAGQIDPEGNLFVPILGRMSLVGLSLDEVETKLAYELSQKYLQEEPEVIALLASPRPIELTVIGEVIRPGYYAFNAGTSLNGVITAVGGSTQQADLRSVIVRRSLIDGTVLEEKIDLYTPLIQGKSLPNIRLQGGDTIIVKRLNTDTARDYDRAIIANTNLSQQTITVRVLLQRIPSGQQLQTVTLPNGSTFIDAIGLLPSSDRLRIKQNQVTLMRFDPDVGKVVTQTLNPESLVFQGDFPQNVLLRDQDVIITSRTLLGQVFAAFNVLTQPFRDVFSFFSFFNQFDRLFDDNNRNR